MHQYGDFDVLAFHAALDAERQARGLGWAAVTRELNRPLAPFPHVHPYSPSTLSDIPKRNRGVGPHPKLVMNLLRWLGRTPESLVPGHPDAANAAQIASDVPKGLGQWNFAALHAAIESQRAEQGQSQDEAAAEIGVPSVWLQKLAAGKPQGGMPAMMRVTLWLGRPATDFFAWTLPLP